MTSAIFAALEARFNANPTLVTVGRKLLQGFDEQRLENVVLPFTEVNIDKTAVQLGTFGSDIDEWDLRFRLHAKDLRTVGAELWLVAMRAMFKDGNLGNYAFHCCGVRESTLMAARNKDSAYDAAIRFLMTVQWRVNSPVTRYA